MTLTPTNSGWIEVICGNMFSGKTEELIRRLRRAQIAKMSTAIFKHIVSHNNNRLKSYTVSITNEILELSKQHEVIGIDEVQFFDDSIIEVCKILASNNKRIIAAGLDTDYLGKPFGPMPKIMCEADYLDKLRAICIKCGNPASYTQRTTSDANQVVIGELDKYEARCRNCHRLPNN